MAKTERDLYGTIELLVLKALSWGPTHGFGIARWVELVSGDELHVEEGSLYPALHRMERKGWIESAWGLSERNRKAKYYRLTPKGRAQLRAESSTWSLFSQAVSKVLTATTAPA
jgi:PadR family transcriptional regulator, regulatory protein PadR